jgi:hypothetical protein
MHGLTSSVIPTIIYKLKTLIMEKLFCMWDGFPVFALGFGFVRNYDLLVVSSFVARKCDFLMLCAMSRFGYSKLGHRIEAFSNAGGTEFVISSSERIYIRTSHTYFLSFLTLTPSPQARHANHILAFFLYLGCCQHPSYESVDLYYDCISILCFV